MPPCVIDGSCGMPLHSVCGSSPHASLCYWWLLRDAHAQRFVQMPTCVIRGSYGMPLRSAGGSNLDFDNALHVLVAFYKCPPCAVACSCQLSFISCCLRVPYGNILGRECGAGHFTSHQDDMSKAISGTGDFRHGKKIPAPESKLHSA
jgi:hypothetical protein